MTIAVCMIVKNEEEVLSRCLESVAGLWDELIIVDTGSTDRTVEIAKSFGAKVLHYEWIAPGHKGEARQFGIDHAVSQWIVVIDADEIMQHAPGVRKALASAPADLDAIRVQFTNYDAAGQPTLTWYQVRIFRRGKYEYKYREHEVPVSLVEVKESQSDIIFEHRVPDGRASGKSAPMLARLTADVAENPNDPHPLYFLHREHLNQGNNAEAIRLGERFIELTGAGGYIRGDVYANLALAHQRQGTVSQARRALHLAAAEEPTRREWWYRLGLLHYECGEWNLSLAALRAAAELAPDYSREWEPATLPKIYDLINCCQHEIAHQMAHSHQH